MNWGCFFMALTWKRFAFLSKSLVEPATTESSLAKSCLGFNVQWAAVSTKCLLRMEPPQRWVYFPASFLCIDTTNGYVALGIFDEMSLIELSMDFPSSLGRAFATEVLDKISLPKKFINYMFYVHCQFRIYPCYKPPWIVPSSRNIYRYILWNISDSPWLKRN